MMTEEEIKERYERDTQANSGKPGLTPEEVTSLLRDWFYAGDAFSATLADPLSHRYADAVAHGFVVQMGKASEPQAYLAQGDPLHTRGLHQALERNHEKWARIAEERRAQQGAAQASGSVPATRVVRTTGVF